MLKSKRRSVFKESYGKLTVGRLRKILEDCLDQLDGWDDDDIVNTVTNTYHLDNPSTYMCVDRIGFINPRELDVEEAWDDDDEEFESLKRTRYRR